MTNKLPDWFWDDDDDGPEPTPFWPFTHPNGPNINGDRFPTSNPCGEIPLRMMQPCALDLYELSYVMTPVDCVVTTLWPEPKDKTGLVNVKLKTFASDTFEDIGVSQRALDQIRAQKNLPIRSRT